ncbi:MAG: hypothetical protein A2945_02225 [Candidatus Liptonbacteria bacterium RIFCSPLOWO2_01_FULL_52_25]|uniref:DUF5050 domain-containing protein n=1 Tax=Candidatus Liptonbacteria bacterium RIFCSPLOWO2_01_FULL_52_25 TaxID=1798650 RepID=A0A1G2CGL4_9BACT|nr:MAG: hypothetical protein A2945_02225 [Candidatus Liptonbacteria bacterium RIFCSPLOWO2_01_FULL_52_25]
MKRYLYIFIAIAGLALVGLAAYYFLTNTFGVAVTPTPTPPGGLPGQNGNGPGGPGTPPPSLTPPAPAYTPEQKFGVVAQNQVAAFHVNTQNDALLVQPDGIVVKVMGGNTTILSSSVIADLLGASFSADGTKLSATFGERTSPQASVFDAINKSWRSLPAGVAFPVWASTGTQVMYFQKSGDTSMLSTFDPFKTGAKAVELLKSFRLEDHTVQWLTANQALFLPRGTALAQGAVWSFDVKNKTLAPLTNERRGISSLWSGAANMGLVFATDQTLRGGTLTLFDTTGNALSGLKVKTLPSKCAFATEEVVVSTPPTQTTTTAGQTGGRATSTRSTTTSVLKKWLYCAVPRDTQKFDLARLPDDYDKKKLFTVDDFYKIDLGDGSITEVFADPAQALDAAQLQVANQTLFFVNRYDQRLYAISLK